jgi:precorrin-3B C17-methyltransferase
MSGTVYLIGLGPGDMLHLTPEARAALRRVGAVVGHPDALRHLRRLVRGKEVVAIAQDPQERSRAAVARAQAGQDVAIVSPGHPGIYAIASTFFSYLQEKRLKLKVEVVPGLSLAEYAASRLGSPLGSDWAVISLADQSSGWPAIRQRLQAALAGGFVVVIYNPRGKLGAERLAEARNFALTCRKPGVPVGLVSEATRAGEQVMVTTLAEFDPAAVTPDTLLIIGNNESFIYEGRFITPRPYTPGLGY